MKKWWLLLIFLIFIVGGYITYRAPVHNVSYGVSFSPKYARELGLNIPEVYENMLRELHPSVVKLSTYFDDISPKPEVFDTNQLDHLIDLHAQTQVPVILAIGVRTPRWPECHMPSWYQALSVPEQKKALLSYLQKMVKRYDGVVSAWQVENEPYLSIFGNCPPFDLDLFREELNLVHALSQKPVFSTASGELGSWSQLAKDPVDFVGISMYRVVWNPWLGYFYHVWSTPAAYYDLKYLWYQQISNKPIWVTELQAEPWGNGPITSLSPQEESRSMSHEHFKRIFNFFEKTSFDQAFLWGAEWWYYKKQQGDSFYWDFVKEKHL